jgi:aspartyl protease family protein
MINRLVFFCFLAVMAALLIPSLTRQNQSPETAAQALNVKMDARREPAPATSGRVLLSADARGHFFATIHINGQSLDAMVDTGASSVGMRQSDAERLGLVTSATRRDVQVSTANGTVEGTRVQLPSVRLGSITAHGIEAVVLPDNALSHTLLGMSFLSRMSKFEMNKGRLVLER